MTQFHNWKLAINKAYTPKEDEAGRGNGGWHKHFIDHYCSDRNNSDDEPYCLLHLRIQIALLSVNGRVGTRPEHDEKRK